MLNNYQWLRDGSKAIILSGIALLSLFTVTIVSNVVVPNAIAQEIQHAEAIESDETQVNISDGSITWGILKSWRQYVGADHITTSGGVEILPSGEFSWPITSG